MIKLFIKSSICREYEENQKPNEEALDAMMIELNKKYNGFTQHYYPGSHSKNFNNPTYILNFRNSTSTLQEIKQSIKTMIEETLYNILRGETIEEKPIPKEPTTYDAPRGPRVEIIGPKFSQYENIKGKIIVHQELQAPKTAPKAPQVDIEGPSGNSAGKITVLV